MKKLIAMLAVCLFVIGTLWTVSAVRAAEPLPTCSQNGDMDGDGVPDADDSDETDSCLASSTGLENCSTGAGDGVPDCALN